MSIATYAVDLYLGMRAQHVSITKIAIWSKGKRPGSRFAGSTKRRKRAQHATCASRRRYLAIISLVCYQVCLSFLKIGGISWWIAVGCGAQFCWECLAP
jgi:hypothetical protein